jgi:dolichyl-phosphate-mannose-protein mannosyltransferase
MHDPPQMVFPNENAPYSDYLAPAVPYVQMRLFCGILGLLTIPMSYITVKAAGHSTAAALVAASLVCFGKV